MILPRWLRRLWRLPIWLRYQLRQRRRLNRPRMTTVGDRRLVLLPGVFDPGVFQTGRFFAEALSTMRLSPNEAVLDLGAGSGILAVEAASAGCHVTAVDINPDAVRCCRINAQMHKLGSLIEVLEGDLFDPVGDRRFDMVLFNPPYLGGKPRNLTERAFRDPEMPRRFARDLRQHLRPKGRALILLSSSGREDEFLEALKGEGWSVRLVRERDLIAEQLRLFAID